MLNRMEKLSAENAKAIKLLDESGILVVPSSGRTYCDLPQEIKENKNFRYIIHSNGAVIIDRKTGRRELMCIPSETACAMLDIINSYESHITIRHNGECMVDGSKQSAEDYRYYNVQKGHGELINKFARFSPNFTEESRLAENIELLSVFFHDNGERAECKKRLLDLGDLLVAEAYDHNLEICYYKAGKGNALKKLAEITDTDINDTIAVGDSDNDVTAVLTAGLGLATENACLALKNVSDAVICSNEEHVIKYILDNYIEVL